MLLTRLPLTPKDAFDLHVLSLPPAFALSQDQTLNLESDLTQDLTELTEPHQRAGVSTSPSELSSLRPTLPPARKLVQNVDPVVFLNRLPKGSPQGQRRPRFSSHPTCQRAKDLAARKQQLPRKTNLLSDRGRAKRPGISEEASDTEPRQRRRRWRAYRPGPSRLSTRLMKFF